MNISNQNYLFDQMVLYATIRKKRGNFNNQNSLKIHAKEKLSYENLDPSNIKLINTSE